MVEPALVVIGLRVQVSGAKRVHHVNVSNANVMRSGDVGESHSRQQRTTNRRAGDVVGAIGPIDHAITPSVVQIETDRLFDPARRTSRPTHRDAPATAPAPDGTTAPPRRDDSGPRARHRTPRTTHAGRRFPSRCDSASTPAVPARIVRRSSCPTGALHRRYDNRSCVPEKAGPVVPRGRFECTATCGARAPAPLHGSIGSCVVSRAAVS